MLRDIARRMRAALRRRSSERDMQEEMSTHIQRATERYVARGLSPAEARAAAVREFGNMPLLQEQARDIRGARWIDDLEGDVRFALRHFRRTPLTTAALVTVLALGIGVNSALFTIVHAIATRAAPGIPRNERLVRIRGTVKDIESGALLARALSYREIIAATERRDVFRDVAAWASDDVVLGAGGDERIVARAFYVTPSYFAVLGVSAALGTTLPRVASGDVGGSFVAVISDRLWHDRFGASREAIGKTLTVDGHTVTVIGVAPPRFVGPNAQSSSQALWLPLDTRPELGRGAPGFPSSLDSAELAATAILRAGVSIERATSVAQTVMARTAPSARRPSRFQSPSADVVPLLAGNEAPSLGTERMTLGMFASVTLLILLIVCANVSALLAGAGVARRREIGVRLSLGAARSRVVRQLLTESVLLATCAGALGLVLLSIVLATFGTRVSELDLTPDWTTVAFTVALAWITGVLFGLSPALHATRLSVAEVLKNSAGAGATGRSGLQRRLIVLQIALTQPLLLALGALLILLIQDARGSSRSPFADRVVVVDLNTSATHASPDDVRRDLTRLSTRLANSPGIEAVAPHTGGYVLSTFTTRSDASSSAAAERREFTAHGYFADSAYFGLMGLTIVRGRPFARDERDAVIIGSDLARSLWGSSDPIGKRFERSRHGQASETDAVVVGVVDAARAGPSVDGTGMRVYLPRGASLRGGLGVSRAGDAGDGAFLVRTRGAAAETIPAIRALIRAEVPRLPIQSLATLAELDAQGRADRVRLSEVAATGGVLALLLASIGLYAVVALAVGQRRREIGVRVALGARASQVIAPFVLVGTRLSAIGILAGLPLSVLALKIVGADLHASNALLAVATAFIVLAVASFATWLPARRAATIDPTIALRAE